MGSRLRWAVVVAVVALVAGAVGVGADRDSFDDDGGVHEPSVNFLAVAGVFEGTECGDRLICPEDPLLRWVMAVWVTRALGRAPETPDVATRFADVDPDVWWVSYVERLADLGVTEGCETDPLRYCPDRPVTRAQMATFLVRAFGLEAAPSAGFADTEGNTHAASIDALSAVGVTAGCETGPLRYCPDRAVTRAQMATFLVRALNLIPDEETTTFPLDEGERVSDAVGVARLFGGDRYETSLAVAAAYANERGGQLDSVVLVSGTSWPDAATAAGLGGRLDAPVVLVGLRGLSSDARSFLDDAGVSQIVAVGSHSAIPVSVLEGLSTIDPSVERIAGADRYSVSVAVARRMGLPGMLAGRGRTVILVSGEASLDAVVAGPFAARGAHPVLLTPPTQLHAAVADYIADSNVDHVVIIGGPTEVSAAVQGAVTALGPAVTRLAGATPFETAAAVAGFVQDAYTRFAERECFGTARVALAAVSEPFHAFTAGPLLARLCAPMLWTNHRNVPQASARYVNAGTDTLIVLDGSAAVSPQAITQLAAATEFGANGRARAQITQAEDHMLALINKERARLDTEPLHRHPTLDEIARDWSTQMRDGGFLAHNPAHFGLTPWPWDALGENVARVPRGNTLTDAAQAAYDSFATSRGHYLNMINPDFTHIGVGFAVGDRKVLVTQNFAGYPYDPITRPPERPVIDLWKPDHNDVGARWEATSPLAITHWQIDDDGMPGEAPPFDHGYQWTDVPERTYRLSVAACNAAGCGPQQILTFTVGDPDPIPGTPPAPTVTATIEGTNATITWNGEPGDAPIEAWTYHFVRHVTDDHIEFTHLHLPARARTRTEYNLVPGRYSIWILAHNTHGPGQWARATFTVTSE